MLEKQDDKEFEFVFVKTYELPVVSNTLPEEEKANSEEVVGTLINLNFFLINETPDGKIVIKLCKWHLNVDVNMQFCDCRGRNESDIMLEVKQLQHRCWQHWQTWQSWWADEARFRNTWKVTRWQLCDRPRASVWRWLVVEFAQWSLTWVERYILKIRWLKVPLQLCKGK